MWTVLDSPVGPLRLVAHRGALIALEFAPDAGEDVSPNSSRVRAQARSAGRPAGDRADEDPVLVEAARQLTAYFGHGLTDFDLPLRPDGSDFARRVWAELGRIPYGETATYGEVARRLGLTVASSRAVGLANGRNPLPIVVPCHRVVGSNGSLTGYAGGVSRKRSLLELEQQALF